jgi:uncharacterized protein YndB with AHSA1/START domain
MAKPTATDSDTNRQTLSAAEQSPVVEVRRLIRAPRQRVFDAWTKEEELRRWHAPGPAVVDHVEVDLRVGGQYLIQMRGPEGQPYHATGIYREIDPPKRLVYSWTWTHEPLDSTVTVEFLEVPTGTEVVIRHAGLPTPKDRSGHEAGWVACFDKLESAIEHSSHL